MKEEQSAFEAIKMGLQSSRFISSYFDLNLRSSLIVDTSPHGLGVVVALVQSERGVWPHKLCYSQGLTPVACQHFRLTVHICHWSYAAQDDIWQCTSAKQRFFHESMLPDNLCAWVSCEKMWRYSQRLFHSDNLCLGPNIPAHSNRPTLGLCHT